VADLRVVASSLEFPEGPVALADGSLLIVEIAGGTLTRIQPDGSRQVLARLGGGPNGAAIGPDGRCFVCNNGGIAFYRSGDALLPGLIAEDYCGGRIEAVDLATGAVEVLYRACGDIPLRGPNDLVFDCHGGFYFTDSGKVMRRTRDRGAVFYARADGSLIRQVVFPVEGANGIGLSPDGGTLYVAEAWSGRLWAYAVAGPGEILRQVGPVPWERGRLVWGSPGYSIFDSLAVEAGGNICVADIPNGGIAVFSPEGALVERHPMPDIFTTNICFGGPDMRTAYVTLSSTGRLVAMEWPRPGLPLPNFNQH
jgi:gluconolactonase